ncbi:hypothetical protein OTU49_005964 [Cherax quadricarinatus]|uniref:Uncharacterized protein n=1 Tax=Cherax quadricarinatus TaxID=27406 RepID=A0AAW0WV09_CHEQU
MQHMGKKDVIDSDSRKKRVGLVSWMRSPFEGREHCVMKMVKMSVLDPLTYERIISFSKCSTSYWFLQGLNQLSSSKSCRKHYPLILLIFSNRLLHSIPTHFFISEQ